MHVLTSLGKIMVHSSNSLGGTIEISAFLKKKLGAVSRAFQEFASFFFDKNNSIAMLVR